jgi:hypothetical protein
VAPVSFSIFHCHLSFVIEEKAAGPRMGNESMENRRSKADELEERLINFAVRVVKLSGPFASKEVNISISDILLSLTD